MTIDAYTRFGENEIPPLIIQAPRDPINDIDFVSPNGQPYNRNQEWFNTVDKTFWFYQGQKQWIKMSGTAGPLIQFTGGNGTTGFPVDPDGTGHIQLTSNASTIAITGSLNSINFDLAGGGIAVDQVNVDAHTAPGTDPVLPTAAGQITITGSQVANGVIGANVIRTDSLAANTFTIEIQRSAANATTDSTKNGISHYSSNQFSVDANGFVELVGGTAPAIQKVNVDAHTAPGTDPVLADGSGQIIVTGAQVAPGVIGTNVIRTNSLAANTYTIEIQQTSAVAAKDTTKNGVAHFNSAQFTNDEGFISLSGGGLAIDSLGVEATSGTGTNPVIPDGAGKIETSGALVAAGTNPIRSVSQSVNSLQIQVQTSQALAATDATKVGLSNFDSLGFAVDANGFVTLNPSTNTFTPTLSFGGASVGITYTSQTGRYWLVGPIVFFVLSITLSNKGVSVGAALISGLPFACSATGATTVQLSAGNLTNTAGYTGYHGTVGAGTSTIAPIESGSGAPTLQLTDVNFANTTQFVITGFYVK